MYSVVDSGTAVFREKQQVNTNTSNVMPWILVFGKSDSGECEMLRMLDYLRPRKR
jgi:hypothetical protein